MIQLFQNLIGNAVKFQDGGHPIVSISSEWQSGKWLLRVKDNGIGFSPEQSTRIFNVFHRLHGTPQYPGTGIGLAL